MFANFLSSNITGRWFGSFFICPFYWALGIVTPTDFHIFQMGWIHQPDKSHIFEGFINNYSAWLLDPRRLRWTSLMAGASLGYAAAAVAAASKASAWHLHGDTQ